MNADDYEQARNSRRRWAARSLGEVHPRARHAVSPVAAVLARAARDWRRREEAAVAWERLADPQWHGRARVDGVRGNVLIVAVTDASLAFALRRRQAALEQRLRKAAHGLCRLRFRVAGVAGGREAESP